MSWPYGHEIPAGSPVMNDLCAVWTSAGAEAEAWGLRQHSRWSSGREE